MRTLLWAFLGLIALSAIGLGFGRWCMGTSTADPDRDAGAAGLDAPVEIWHDSLGVPQVWAATAEDLYFAQGFLHARERLWQMELFRRVAEGRLSEVLGPKLIESDRFLRTIGLWRAAGANERALDAEVRGWLEAYAAGVNAWIRERRGALPPEFVVLRSRPEPGRSGTRWAYRR